MNDGYQELLIQRKQKGYEKTVKTAVMVFMVLFLAAGLLINPFLFIGAVVLAVLYYIQVPKLFVEYEYLLVSNELQVDAIYSRQKRKKMKQIDLGQVVLMTKEGSHELDAYQRYEKVDYSAQDPADKAYVLVVGDGGKQVQYFLQLSGEMLQEIRNSMGRRYRNIVSPENISVHP